jgi:hypothetical protein
MIRLALGNLRAWWRELRPIRTSTNMAVRRAISAPYAPVIQVTKEEVNWQKKSCFKAR